MPRIGRESVWFGVIRGRGDDTMNRLAMTGLALAVGGAIGLLSLEMVGTAYAGRSADRDYLVAVGVAAPVKFVAMPAMAERTDVVTGRSRVLVCRGGVLGFGALSVGYRCGTH